jgi:hypothetical protein
MFSQTIHHETVRGAKDHAPCENSTQASALAARKQTQPTMLGLQMRTSCSRQSRPAIMASPVLKLNVMVPTSCIALASQPRLRGLHPSQRQPRTRESSASATSPLAASRSCR